MKRERRGRRTGGWTSAVYAAVVLAAVAAATVPIGPPVDASETAPVVELLVDASGD